MMTCFQLGAQKSCWQYAYKYPCIQMHTCRECNTLEGLTIRVQASAFGVSPAIRPRPAPLVASTSLGIAPYGLSMTFQAE